VKAQHTEQQQQQHHAADGAATTAAAVGKEGATSELMQQLLQLESRVGDSCAQSCKPNASDDVTAQGWRSCNLRTVLTARLPVTHAPGRVWGCTVSVSMGPLTAHWASDESATA
jgi:hypothetical protein